MEKRTRSVVLHITEWKEKMPCNAPIFQGSPIFLIVLILLTYIVACLELKDLKAPGLAFQEITELCCTQFDAKGTFIYPEQYGCREA